MFAHTWTWLVLVSVSLLSSVAGQCLCVHVCRCVHLHPVFSCLHVCPCAPSCLPSFSRPTSSQAFLPLPSLGRPSFLRSPGDCWAVLGAPLYPSTVALHPSGLSLPGLPPTALSTPPLSAA